MAGANNDKLNRSIERLFAFSILLNVITIPLLTYHFTLIIVYICQHLHWN